MSIFVIILTAVSINVFILLFYRQLDRKNRSLSKVKRYADMVKDKLSSFVDGKTGEINNLAIELQVNLKTGKEILNRIRGESDELRDKTGAIEGIRKRIAGYDKSLKELDSMSIKVDENLKRIHGESKFVDSLSKRLTDVSAQMLRVEKRIPALVDDWRISNQEQLAKSVIQLQSGMEEKLGNFSEQLDETEHRVTDFSTYITRLEARREELEAETVKKLNVVTEQFVLQSKETKTKLSADIDQQKGMLLDEVERKGTDFEERVRNSLHQFQEREQSLVVRIDEKFGAYKTDMEAMERSYHGKLQSAAQRGESLETNIFNALKKRIEEKAIILKKTMEQQHMELVESNLLKVRENADLVEGLGKRIREAAVRVVRVEKKIPEIITELNRRNQEQLSRAAAIQKKDVEDRINQLAQGIDTASNKLQVFSGHVAGLEQRRDSMLVETEQNIQVLAQEFSLKAKDMQSNVTSDLELQMNDIIKSMETARSQAQDEIQENLHHAQEKYAEMDSQLREKINVFEADLSNLEISYKNSLEEAAKRGESLEHEAFDLIKERIDGNASALHKEITSKLKALEFDQEENRKELVELFGNTRSDVTVWRAEITQNLKESDLEVDSRIQAMNQHYDENTAALSERLNAQMAETEEKYQLLDGKITNAMTNLGNGFNGFRKDIKNDLDQTQNLVHQSMAKFRSEIGEKLEQERVETQRKLAQINQDMQQIEELSNGLRKDLGVARGVMEEASQGIETRIDSFAKDYYERIAWASEQLESKILEKVDHRLEEYEGDASYRFKKLEEVNLDIVALEKNLRDVMGKISEQIEGDMNSFAKLIEERRHAEEARTDTLITNIRNDVIVLEESLDGLKEKAYQEVEVKLKDFEDGFFTDLSNRSEGMEKSIIKFQLEMSERLHKVADDQGQELEQIEKKHADTLNSRFLVLQDKFSSSLENIKDAFDSQREEIIHKNREERDQARSELAEIEEKNAVLGEQLDEKTVSVYSFFQKKQEELDQDFKLKSDNLRTSINEQIAAFRSASSDIKEKTETFRDKLFGQIEENYKELAQKLADIEEQQKDFLAQTKLFKRADSFKAELERNIGELKKNLTLLEPQRKDMQVIEAEFRNTKAIVEEVSGKIARFQAERKRIEDLEKNFNRLFDLSQTVDGKLDSVTNHHDLLEEIQVKIRQIEEVEEEIESRYVRLEKKKSVLDNTARGVEKNFRFLSDLENQIKETSSTLMSFQPQIEGISGTIELLSSKKDQSDMAVENLGRLDKFLGEIEERMEKLQTAREWLANTETRLESLGNQAQDQVNLLRTLIKAEADSGKERGAPPIDKRQTVLKLAKLGWKPKEIAQTTQMSRGEVELILELAPQPK